MCGGEGLISVISVIILIPESLHLKLVALGKINGFSDTFYGPKFEIHVIIHCVGSVSQLLMLCMSPKLLQLLE